MNHPALIEPTTLTVEELLEGDAWALSMSELHVTPEQLGASAQGWCWLLGVPEDDDEARVEAMGDAPLMVALVALPVNDFLRWFQGQDWEHFPRSDMNGELWAWRVGLRACELRDKAGPMLAAQSSVATLAFRFRDMQ